mgnify:FL=1|tara:strand:- start:379 stop:582 length:204 start_codon:yes stop_codon:yes gene_type:complete
MDFKKGDEVWVLDFPFGKPLNVRGRIIGESGKDHYNVLIETGLLEGDIVKYKYWKLFPVDNQDEKVL